MTTSPASIPWRHRLATSDDVPALVRLINAAYRLEEFFVTGDRTSAQAIRDRMAPADAAFLVVDAPTAGQLAAAVFVLVRGDRGYFGMLSVDPSHQRRGLGRWLALAAEAHCRAAGCVALDIDVVDLRTELPPFYESLGFRPVATAPFPHPERLRRAAHLVVMSKSLRGE